MTEMSGSTTPWVSLLKIATPGSNLLNTPSPGPLTNLGAVPRVPVTAASSEDKEYDDELSELTPESREILKEGK
jgi:hypothetical protein